MSAPSIDPQRIEQVSRALKAAMAAGNHDPYNLAFALEVAGLLQSPEKAAELTARRNDALAMRGALSPNGFPARVPMPLGETLLPAVEWLLARVAELEVLNPARFQDCQVCGAGYEYGQPCSNCEFKARIAAAITSPEDPYNGPLHHDYATPRDLPAQHDGRWNA